MLDFLINFCEYDTCGEYRKTVANRRKGVISLKKQAHKSRITLKPDVCGGRPCIRDTRIEIAVILDGMAEGLTESEIIDHYPQLTLEDIRAALAYAADLSHESIWKTTVSA